MFLSFSIKTPTNCKDNLFPGFAKNMITAKNQDNSLKTQKKSCKQLCDPKESQSDSRNNNTISKYKHN